jgi:DNA-packaging protein gp3
MPTKPGREKYIESPEKMLQYFEDYKGEVKARPIQVTDWVGGMAMQVTREKERPLTIEGFENYLFNQGIISDVSDYFENKGGRYAQYVPICRTIRKLIRQDQIEGGMAGIYNPSITQRLNGLVDSTKEDVKKEVKITVVRGDRRSNKAE